MKGLRTRRMLHAAKAARGPYSLLGEWCDATERTHYGRLRVLADGRPHAQVCWRHLAAGLRWAHETYPKAVLEVQEGRQN